MGNSRQQLQTSENLRHPHRDSAAERIALDSLADGVIIADQDGRFLSFNPMAERILGIGSRDVSPQEWTTVYGCYYKDQVTPYPPDQLPLARAIRGEQVTEEVIFIRNPEQPDGVWISVSSTPLMDPAGLVHGGVVILRDITEHQRAIEKAMQLAMAVEQTADSILITDKQGVIEYVNPGFEATTGYSRDEAIGNTPRILKSGHQDVEFYGQMWGQITSGEHFRATVLNRKKNGDLFWAEQTITPLKDEDGNITNYVSVLKDITELRAKQEQDLQLEIARKIQQRLFPAPISLPGLDIAGGAYPADETGGDYYDFIPTPDGCLWVVVGDASGHGIGSALVMAETRAYLRSYARMGLDPAEVLYQVNQELTIDEDKERFVPTIIVRLDPEHRSLVYANAGHNPGYILSDSGEVVTEMRTTGIPLGSFPDYRFSCSEPIELPPGSLLALFTDGISEAMGPENAQFGFDRALEVIRRHQRDGAGRVVEHLYQAVRAFSGDRPQHDDITSVICKLNAIGR